MSSTSRGSRRSARGLIPLALGSFSIALAACGYGGGGGSGSGACTRDACDSGDAGDSGGTDSDGGGGGTDSGGESAGDSDGLPPGFWPGVECVDELTEQEEAGRPIIHFDVEAGRAPGKDFFRLPFPNDIRRRASGIELTGFPIPPPEFTEAFGDVVDRWVDALEHDTRGYAVNTAVLFRATHAIDLGAAGSSLRIVNIEPGHPDYGKPLSAVSYRAEGGPVSRTSYLCQNWMGLEPVDGVVLASDATYAYVVTDGVRPLAGGAFSPDDDFVAMLSASAPTDSARKQAWDVYAPLRAFLSSPENTAPGGLQLSADQLLAAAVVTTGDHLAPLADARASLEQSAAPALLDVKVCDGNGESPCASGLGLTDEERNERRCGSPNDDFVELHGRLRIPIFQQGTPPYASAGGGLANADAGPSPVGTEDVCFALTVPKAEPADAGWPVVLFAHGTGGSFRSAIPFAGDAAARGLATLTLEGVMHGARRNDLDDAPGDGLVEGLDTAQLVFNVLNPASARDTMLQAALDQLSLARWVEASTPADFPEGVGLEAGLDAANLFYFGHSQGAQAGVLALANAPQLRVAALSGVGSSIVHSVLEKRLPEITPPGASEPMALAELLHLAIIERPGTALSSFHPLMILLNTQVARADADVYARRLFREPPEEAAGRSVLLYAGYVDNYTPLRSAVSLLINAGAPIADELVVPPPCDAYEGGAEIACGLIDLGFVQRVELPVTGNIGGGSVAALTRPASGGEDGHYVALQPAEIDRIMAYFQSALDGATPVIE
ncbi:MAG: hypothetical protein H6713_15010 [Myxococcales bacterium]|nr:hypothetical protein [Myxococcales bacterium]MCB9751284.1 hypothetical protein [Myxococcales bacterium]